jgi:hypothetical protein
METKTNPIINIAKMIATVGLFIIYPFLA